MKLPAIIKIITLLSTACVALVLSTAQAGGIYKWVDAQGNVHYSQEPHGQSAQEMNIKIPKTSDSADSAEESTAKSDTKNASDKTAEKSSDGNDAQTNAEKEAAAKDQKEVKEKNCQIAMKRLASINAGGRLYEVNEKGERSYWDDNTRKAKMEEAQKNVDEWCGQE